MPNVFKKLATIVIGVLICGAIYLSLWSVFKYFEIVS